VIVEQVANGVAVRMAALYLLLSGDAGTSNEKSSTDERNTL
jgi:aspartate carbamoyltransferase catalytic subunit